MNWKTQAAQAIAPVDAPAVQTLDEAVVTQRMSDIEALRSYGWSDFAQSLVRQFTQRGTLSDKQWAAARSMVAKVSAKQAAPEAPRPSNDVQVPRLARLFQPNGFSRFSYGRLSFSRKNDGSCVWIKWDDALVGRLDLCDWTAKLFAARIRNVSQTVEALRALLAEIEADPRAAAAHDGLLTGRCGCCGRELTDPTSIEIGIGPICRERLGGVL